MTHNQIQARITFSNIPSMTRLTIPLGNTKLEQTKQKLRGPFKTQTIGLAGFPRKPQLQTLQKTRNKQFNSKNTDQKNPQKQTE